MQVAARAVPARQPPSTQPQTAATLRLRRDLEPHRALGRVDPDLRAEHRLPGPEREVHHEVVPLYPEPGIRRDPQAEIEVSGRAARLSWLPLPGQAEDEAVARTARDLHVERALPVQADAPLAASQKVLHRDRQLGFDVASAKCHPGPATAGTAPTTRLPRRLAEERFEEVAEVPEAAPVLRPAVHLLRALGAGP